MTALFSWTNHVDRSGASLSASQTAGNLTPDNMAKPQIIIPWRTTSVTAWGQADFGADVAVGCLCLRFRRTNGSVPPSAGTVRHQLDADGGTPGAGVAYDSTAVAINCDADYGYHLIVLSSELSARYWRFTFAVSGVSFIDVGRAWAGPAFRPTINVGYPHDDMWFDRTVISSAGRAGTEWADPRPFQRAIGVNLGAIHEDDHASIRSLMRAAGIGGQVLFCLDPDTADGRQRDTIIGRREQNRALSHSVPTSPKIYGTTLSIRESL